MTLTLAGIPAAIARTLNPCILKLVSDCRCSRRWSCEGYYCSECSLDDVLFAPGFILRGCFRCFLSRVERQKRHQFWQIGGRLVRCGSSNCFIHRVLATFGTRQSRQSQNVGFVGAGQCANAGTESALRVRVPVLSEHSTTIDAASSTAESLVGKNAKLPRENGPNRRGKGECRGQRHGDGRQN
jgi:hypothetical protein